ncbi:interleukin-21 precursor [Xenopus tropicalis]|uniref:Interleukin-21 n=1 Tax=Xenopus tropicalis TaxID=8364 RepID=B2BLM0_XENTR|nr:interleukin-21 precursor [Xenopus tropicalis]ABS50434.1 interleukin-21 [Xenopus tropicalis]|eukprot:NP_001120531.1 interleukin-21 precursor [Xenopus tropicalis]
MANVLLWCLLACSCCILIDAKLPSIERCREIKKGIEEWIIKQANKTHPSFLHTPVDVTAECWESALNCFRYETSHLKEANGQKEEDFKRNIRKVYLKRMHTPENKGCPICTKYPTQKPGDFLESMLLLLQQIIADYPTQTSG